MLDSPASSSAPWDLATLHGRERSEPAFLCLHHRAHQRALRERRGESKFHLLKIPGEVLENSLQSLVQALGAFVGPSIAASRLTDPDGIYVSNGMVKSKETPIVLARGRMVSQTVCN